MPHLTLHLSSLSEKDRNCPIPNWGIHVVELMFWHQEGERTEGGKEDKGGEVGSLETAGFVPKCQEMGTMQGFPLWGRRASLRTTPHGTLRGTQDFQP